MTEEKLAEVFKTAGDFTKILDRAGLHYRIVIVRPGGEGAQEFGAISNRELFSDVCCCIYNLIEDSELTREEYIKKINAGLDELEGLMEEDKNGNKSE